MPNPDETLAAIGEVITWHGSRDAMVRTAEPPQRRAPVPRVDPDGARRLAGEVGAAVQALAEQLWPAFESMGQALAEFARSPAVRQLVEFANSPEGRALIEAHERGEIEPGPGPCNCLCVYRHPDRAGICTGEAAGEMRYRTRSLGVVDVTMCAPCLEAEGSRT